MRQAAQKTPVNGNAHPMTGLTSITAKRSRAVWPIVRCSAWKSPDRAITAINLLTSYNPLSITAIDWTLQRGPFEIIGEAAWAYARGNSRAIPGIPDWICSRLPTDGNQGGNSGPGIPPQRMHGLLYPGQLSFHAGVLDQTLAEAVWRGIHVYRCDPVRQGEHQPG